MIDYKFLDEKFTALYGQKARFFRAPGRVNLIGEHTDYNDGFVLPMAIERETVVAAAPRNDGKVRAYTINFEEKSECDLREEYKNESRSWFDYIEGTARISLRNGANISGADLLIFTNIPTGAGLSSSAALETATGLALSEISGRTIDKKLLARIGQQTEHEFIGAKVGIMDQFVSANASAKCALFLDCRTLEFENVPLDTSDAAIVICDTNIKHEIAASGYNTRRAECAEAVAILKKFLPEISHLRDVSTEDFEINKKYLPEVIRRRAKHIVAENERVQKAVKALKANDLYEFGKLMSESHESMRDDYEISCRELDLLVEIAGKIEGVLGARMTGGGFGGSTVNLVKRDKLENFCAVIEEKYLNSALIKPTILITEAGIGASEITL